MKESDGPFRPAKRYRYTENYRINPETGKTEYSGTFLNPKHPETLYRDIRAYARRCALATACALLLLVGIQYFSVYQGGLYVFIPITAAVFPELYLTLGIYRLPKTDRALQQDTWQLAHRRIRRSAFGICSLLGIAAILFLVFLLSGGGWKTIDWLFVILLLLPTIGNGLLIQKLGKLSYKE